MLLLALVIGILSCLASVSVGGLLCAVVALLLFLTQPKHVICVWLGVFVPLAPLFGSGTLLLVLSLFFLVDRGNRRNLDLSWAMPILLVLLISVLADFLYGYRDFLGMLPFSLSAVRAHLLTAPPSSLLALLTCYRYLMLACLIAYFIGDTEARRDVEAGVVRGLLIALPLAVVQVLGIGPDWFPNLTHFWHKQGRYPATFSDPNAFGLSILLCFPLFLSYRLRSERSWAQFSMYVLAASWGVLALFSGSRSFLLGLVLFSCAMLYAYSRRVFASLLLVLGLCVASIEFWAWYAPDQFSAFLTSQSYGFQRLLYALQPSYLGQTFGSRFVFWHMGWEMWLDHWLFGIGLQHFRDLITLYSQHFAIDLGVWSDNSNNFYLGLLAEGGLIAFAALLWGVSQFRLKDHRYFADELYRAGFWTFVVLLFFGPHFAFDEVCVLVSLVIANIFRLPSSQSLFQKSSEVLSKPGAVCLFVILFGGILLQASQRPQGFYFWEKDAGKYFVWIRPHARGWLACRNDLNQDAYDPQSYDKWYADLHLLITHPKLDLKPLQVSLSGPADFRESRSITAPGELSFRIPCQHRRRVRFGLDLSRGWIPAQNGAGADYRILGARLLNSPQEIGL